jgi:hypothetical protein
MLLKHQAAASAAVCAATCPGHCCCRRPTMSASCPALARTSAGRSNSSGSPSRPPRSSRCDKRSAYPSDMLPLAWLLLAQPGWEPQLA